MAFNQNHGSILSGMLREAFNKKLYKMKGKK
jgi:hypothetical protein